MMKHIALKASAAALAASMALIAAAPALAQQYGDRDRELAGAPRAQEYPPFFEGQNDRYGDRDNDRRRKPDFQRVQEDCSRAGIQEAWRLGYYSAQYNDGPRLEYGRQGWEMRGKMRLHNRRGYSYVNTVCDVRGGRSGVDIEFLR
ncbi:MAG: hypothetical protein Q8R02_01540 [Hyphomonadaceae bacterium]|nr:hypothetical protein [Hyphomonadaceae bacterium]